jgi:predicted ArsR family transcriptional regulator
VVNATPIRVRSQRVGRNEIDTPFSPNQFSAAVSAVTSAFGDPTRRAVYLMARESGEQGITASEVAAQLALHPNVARHHLHKLAAGGYLEAVPAADVADRRPAKGRPSKRFRAAGPNDNPALASGQRRDNLLVLLLARLMAEIPAERATAVAEEVGFAYGVSLAETMGTERAAMGSRAAMQTVADALTAHGFAAHTEAHGTSVEVVAAHCPYGVAASQHPVICAVDRGLVSGLLGELCDTDATLRPRSHVADVCRVSAETTPA